MHTESKGFVRLEWVCPNCGTRNAGPVKNCENCGAAQPDDVKFQRAAEEAIITDEKEIEAAKAGADIYCGFCGTRNPSAAETCSQCGANLKEGKLRQAGAALEAAPVVANLAVCPSCGTENTANAASCSNCGASLRPAPAPPAPVSTAGAKAVANKKRNWIFAGCAALILLACCIGAFAVLLPSSSTTGTVSSVYWQTSVPLQEVRAVQHTNEIGNPPASAYDVSCRTESRQVCEDKTIDKGNGYGEVVQECHNENTTYCSYTLDEWTTIRSYDLNGTNYSPQYADPTAANGQRLGDSSIQLTVYFNTSKGELKYSPDSVSEFQQFQVGSEWTLKTNLLGAVVSAER
ncbi:MAG: zinc ribbon domain-containing protein [Anaerolineales bacterium]|nr:zinc ribbon domain-containing protein [Anaerolineales bacterium]